MKFNLQFVKIKFENWLTRWDAKTRIFFNWLNKPSVGREKILKEVVVFGGLALMIIGMGSILSLLP